ncbi:hypothetical protein [Streptomyces orinoci]|uniref:Uncharacterized protein n=1 Tax=Streptomyces orinoci TaxID=67339 RepID=A0ABV3JS78_STRON|nr:hypothetical protein [Streptomyces orinoci]
MTARRPLLTAAAAALVLCGVWLVPSAHAVPGGHTVPGSRPSAAPGSVSAPGSAPGSRPAARPHVAPTARQTAADGAKLNLADTGSVDTTPYLVGGVAFVATGGVLVTGAVRRSRTAAR